MSSELIKHVTDASFDADVLKSGTPVLEYSVVLQNLPTGSLCDGQWHHLACTWSKQGNFMRFYLDGQLRADTNERRYVPPTASDNPVYLGVDARGAEVMRVLPRENEDVNECWLADRDRFSYEGLNTTERLTQPMIKHGGEWKSVDWQTALEYVAKGLRQINYTPKALLMHYGVTEPAFVEALLKDGDGVFGTRRSRGARLDEGVPKELLAHVRDDAVAAVEAAQLSAEEKAEARLQDALSKVHATAELVANEEVKAKYLMI